MENFSLCLRMRSGENVRSIFWNWFRACMREFSFCSLKK